MHNAHSGAGRLALAFCLSLAASSAFAEFNPDTSWSGDGAAPDVAGELTTDDDGNVYVLVPTSGGPYSNEGPYSVRKLAVANGATVTGYGTDGTATIPPVGYLAGLCLDDASDSLFLVGSVSSTTLDLRVVKLTSAGAVDETWAEAGLATIAVPGTDGMSIGFGCAVLSDGKLLVVGSGSVTNPDYDPSDPHNQTAFITRLTAAGGLDDTFGAGGARTISMGSAALTLKKVAVAANDKIVAGGTYMTTTNLALPTQLLFARFTSGGAVDSSFNGGKVVVNVEQADDDDLIAMRPQSTGSIVFVAANQRYFYQFHGLVSRLNDNGTIDSSYDSAYGLVPVPTSWWTYTRGGIDPQGRVLVAGQEMDTPFNAIFRVTGRPELSVAGADGVNGTRASGGGGGGGGGAGGASLLGVLALAALARRRRS